MCLYNTMHNGRHGSVLCLRDGFQQPPFFIGDEGYDTVRA